VQFARRRRGGARDADGCGLPCRLRAARRRGRTRSAEASAGAHVLVPRTRGRAGPGGRRGEAPALPRADRSAIALPPRRPRRYVLHCLPSITGYGIDALCSNGPSPSAVWQRPRTACTCRRRCLTLLPRSRNSSACARIRERTSPVCPRLSVPSSQPVRRRRCRGQLADAAGGKNSLPRSRIPPSARTRPDLRAFAPRGRSSDSGPTRVPSRSMPADHRCDALLAATARARARSSARSIPTSPFRPDDPVRDVRSRPRPGQTRTQLIGVDPNACRADDAPRDSGLEQLRQRLGRAHASPDL